MSMNQTTPNHIGIKRYRSVGARSLVGMLTVVAFALLFMFPSPAQAWWKDEWPFRKKITIDTSSTGANITEAIGTTPVLIRLHSGNFRFEEAKGDGSDLRFIAGDDKTPLKFHFEKFDPLLGEAMVWVSIPELKPGVLTDLWLYYGNKKADSAADSKTTYDAPTLLVYHFAQRGVPPEDSTSWANTALTVGDPADGAVIGQGLRLDGQHPVSLPASASLAFADSDPMTLSFWFKPDSLQRNSIVYSRHDGGNALTLGVDDGAPFIEITNASGTQRSVKGAPVAPGGWHHLALTSSPGLTTLYLDGAAYGTLTSAIPVLNSISTIGSDPTPATPAGPAAALFAGSSAGSLPAAASATTASNPSAGSPGAANPIAGSPPPAAAPEAAAVNFSGEIDEFEIAKAARPAGFIRAEYAGQGPDSQKFFRYSKEEETASWFSGYVATILKSVTLDGWVVIGILMVMGIISLAVMIEKIVYVNAQTKANALFLRVYREISGSLGRIDPTDEAAFQSLGGRFNEKSFRRVRHSSVYRVYLIAIHEIHQRFAGPDPLNHLPARSIAAIRAALDSAQFQENQRLNRLIVLLTIAISGGPFLGLLGTVVGVMITFAVIAESGDVNVNAIAPGIAAALVATVAGLAVAIPALFGYNYLVSRIRSLSGDLQMFVEEFTTKMGEIYSEAPRPAPLPLAAE